MTACDKTQTSDYWCCGDKTDCCTTSDAILVKEIFASNNQTDPSSLSGLSPGVQGAIGGRVAVGATLLCAGRNGSPKYARSEAKELVELGSEVAHEIGSGNTRYEKVADPLSPTHEFGSADTMIFERPANIHRY
ncbi:uncharacterized protein N7483_007380 [Penicillium malachiteum]|uniref:uncharacterized protein n=1 Tax=Penicillium malachiteum TaxID=1324776 RepID=UPI0025472DF8|nr:uncharacterized protein N7483_007380 [Penicillium malachiteum]KAJ5726023.1 hypothetical protein N7483_007380 [Penicillium malachiteum]